MLRVLVWYVWLSQNTTDREIYKEMPLTVLEDQSIPRCWHLEMVFWPFNRVEAMHGEKQVRTGGYTGDSIIDNRTAHRII